MAVNDYSGRIWKIVTSATNPTTPFGAQNVKIKGGSWSGGSSANPFTITDGGGRQYTWTWSANSQQITFGELGWLEGPVTFSTLQVGEVDLYLGTK